MKLALRLLAALCVLASGFGATAHAAAGYRILDACYHSDLRLPEFDEFWKDMGRREAELDLRVWTKPPAGSLHVYILNTGTTPLEISDIALAGISLKRALTFMDQDLKREAEPASIYFSDLSQPERKKLIAAGDPIWWRVRAEITAPGEVCEAAVRLRTTPPGSSVKLVLAVKGGRPISVEVPLAAIPRFEGISLSENLGRVHAYCSGTKLAPERVLLNGRDVTSRSVVSYDPRVKVTPIAVDPGAPIKRGSYYCLQVAYPNGSKATELMKAYADEPCYGVWGGKPGEEDEVERAKAYFDDLAAHNINCQMEQIGCPCITSFLSTAEGRDYISARKIRRTINDLGKQGTTNPYFYFLTDEPDAGDFFATGVPAQQKLGVLTQGLIAKAQRLHAANPTSPCAVNVDTTFKPIQYYVYGRVADILQTDPYYQATLSSMIESHPRRYPLYTTAKYIHAAAAVPKAACAPNPLQMVLYAVSGHSKKGETKFRFPTPEEKRMEVYYSLAAGAKQISYWWYTPVPVGTPGANGCGGDSPEAKALWKEIGLLGAEFRTVDWLLANGCPANLAAKSPDNLWVKTLLCGRESIVVLCMNEDYACDRLGTAYVPVPACGVTVTLPNWLKAADAFEVTYRGTQNLTWSQASGAAKLQLGETELTRMIVITSDPKLRATLQARYDERCAANVAKLTGVQ